MARMTDEISQTASLRNLRRLFWLRNVAVIGQCLALLAAVGHFAIDLPLAPLLGAIGVQILLNLLTWRRLDSDSNVTDSELLAQLLADLVLYSVLFYYSGGYTNPFVWMYLLPLTVAAVALPWRHTWLVAGSSVAAYTALMFFYTPLPHQHHHHESSDFSLHLLGMWFGFVLSAGIIAYFVTRIGSNQREYDRLIAEAREKALESERMLALGTLATSAAHELGTPLATMAVITGELVRDCKEQPQLQESVMLLKGQIERCKEILTSITASAGQRRADKNEKCALKDYLNKTLADWQTLHPTAHLKSEFQGDAAKPIITIDRTLSQALVNLLDNAADVSSEVELFAAWTEKALTLTIRDHGPGLSTEAADKAGTPFFTTKPERGMGLGLYLARLIFERFGGHLNLTNHADGGAVTTVRLPLKALLIGEISA